MREKRMVERGPRKSGREEFGEMRGREGFWIGWEEAARDEISCARELRVSSGRLLSKRERGRSSSERYQVWRQVEVIGGGREEGG